MITFIPEAAPLMPTAQKQAAGDHFATHRIRISTELPFREGICKLRFYSIEISA